MVFSKNVHLALQLQFASILEVKCVEEHDLYLGLPLHVGRSKSAKFGFLKDRISWCTKILSATGKEILIKVVAQAIPTYVMSCYMLSKSLCDDLHQLCAQFCWGQT